MNLKAKTTNQTLIEEKLTGLGLTWIQICRDPDKENRRLLHRFSLCNNSVCQFTAYIYTHNTIV